MFVGMDFGTTNSAVAVARRDHAAEIVTFSTAAGPASTLRSVLAFDKARRDSERRIVPLVGHDAIDAYLHGDGECRFLQSFKSYLTSRSFTGTSILGTSYSLEDLVALIVAHLRRAAETTGVKVEKVVAGRPVRFAGERADDDFGADRLRAAFAEAGLPDVTLGLEPEGAGYRFARTLDRAATVLIGDFGGGTSDFSVLRFDPHGSERVRPLGVAGIGLAGDVFDYRIIDRVIAPRLGKGTSYSIMGKTMPVPIEYYSAFSRWHRLSLMKTPRTLREIADVARSASHPERLHALIRLIEDELGYRLYQAVSAAKAALSTQQEVTLRFAHRELDIAETITRADFEGWIAPDLAALSATVDAALAQAGLADSGIDHVFLTGGTAFVPAVRRLFDTRFGADRVGGGGEFVSVAEGLALIGRDHGG